MLVLFYTISRYIEPAPKKEITIGTGSKNGNSIEKLNNLKTEVQQHTKVPLAYKGEYYDLLLHIDLVIKNYKM
jgi:hypothetical protein